jgi:hypothetical protein
MDVDALCAGAARLNASQRAELSLRLYSRFALQPLGIVLLDRLIGAAPSGLSLDDLTDTIQVPKHLLSAELDAHRQLLVSAIDPSSALKDPSPSVSSSVTAAPGSRVAIDFRKALVFVAASFGGAFVRLCTVLSSDLPTRFVALGTAVSDAAVHVVVCRHCGVQHRLTDLKDGAWCGLCARHLGFDNALAAARWILTPPEKRPARDSLSFIVPHAMERDERLCVNVAVVCTLLGEPFCSLTNAVEIRDPAALLGRDERNNMLAHGGAQTLRYAEPPHLRIRVVTRDELEESRRGPRAPPPTLPPWLGGTDSGGSTRATADRHAKRTRSELVCWGQLRPAANEAEDDDEMDQYGFVRSTLSR